MFIGITSVKPKFDSEYLFSAVFSNGGYNLILANFYCWDN